MRPDLEAFPILFFHADFFAEVCQLSSFWSDIGLCFLHFRRYSHFFIEVNHLIGHGDILRWVRVRSNLHIAKTVPGYPSNQTLNVPIFLNNH